MRLVRPLAAAALAVLTAGLVFGATPPAPPEKKSSAAKPVPAPPTPETPEPPEPPEGRRGGDLQGINEDITIHEGETHDGSITCIRGHVTIDGHVNGDVVVVAGSLDLKGEVDGDVTTVFSHVGFDPKADVEGDLTQVGGTLDRNGAKIQGQVVNIPLGITVPSWGPHPFRSGWGEFEGFLFWWKLFATFLFFVCALLLSALVPDRIRLISEESPHRLFSAFVFGLIGYMVFVFSQLFLVLTVIGIPLVFLLYLVFVVLKWLAMCGIFHQIGRRLGRSLGREMSLLGAILLGMLPFALLRFVPFCIGFCIWFLVEILAFGYLILTRVGTRGGPAPAAAPVATITPQPVPGTIST